MFLLSRRAARRRASIDPMRGLVYHWLGSMAEDAWPVLASTLRRGSLWRVLTSLTDRDHDESGNMHFEHSALVPVDRDQLWSFMIDVPQMATCVPGVSQIRPMGGNRFQGVLAVRLGPFGLNVSVRLTVGSSDQARGHATMDADAADRWLGNALRASFQMQLNDTIDGTTMLVIVTDLADSGRFGQLGQPLIRAKADSIFDEFVSRIHQRFPRNLALG